MLEHIFKLENRIMLDAVSPVADIADIDILVVSQGIDDYADLAAAAKDIDVIEYNPNAENALDTLLQDIQNAAKDATVDGISFATHGDNPLITSEPFLKGISDVIGEGGRLDFLACELSDNTIDNIQSIVGKSIDVFASDDITGKGGDWELELSTTGVAMDITGNDGYLDANTLAEFTGTLKTDIATATNGGTGASSTMTYVDADTIEATTTTTATSQIVIDLSGIPSPTAADHTITFSSGAGGDNRISIASDDTEGTLRFQTGRVTNDAVGTTWDQTQATVFGMFTKGTTGTFNFNPTAALLPDDYDSLNGADDPEINIVKTDNASEIITESTTTANINQLIDGTTYVTPTTGGIYAVLIAFDTNNPAIADVSSVFFVEVIPYVVPFKAPGYIPLDEIPQDTFPADFTNQQYRNLPYDPLNVMPPELINVAPLDIYSGTDFVSIDVLQPLSMSERDMDSSYFADGATGDPSKLASSVNYGELAMGIPDFLTLPEINSVIYLSDYQDNDIAKVSTEPTAADVMRLGYYPSEWEVTNVNADGSGYYIKIEDNIYYINLKSPIEYCGARVASYNGDDAGTPPPVDDNFISQHLKHLKKIGKDGLFNNFKKVAICDR